MIKLVYFGRVRSELGVDSEAVPVPAGGEIALAALIAELAARGGAYGQVFGGGQPVLMAINQEMANADMAAYAGDEVAFFPPVTGG